MNTEYSDQLLKSALEHIETAARLKLCTDASRKTEIQRYLQWAFEDLELLRLWEESGGVHADNPYAAAVVMFYYKVKAMVDKDNK